MGVRPACFDTVFDRNGGVVDMRVGCVQRQRQR